MLGNVLKFFQYLRLGVLINEVLILKKKVYLALLNKNRQNFRCFHAGGKKKDGNLISEKKEKSQFFSFESDEL